jgi:hypothetical protein
VVQDKTRPSLHCVQAPADLGLAAADVQARVGHDAPGLPHPEARYLVAHASDVQGPARPRARARARARGQGARGEHPCRGLHGCSSSSSSRDGGVSRAQTKRRLVD